MPRLSAFLQIGVLLSAAALVDAQEPARHAISGMPAARIVRARLDNGLVVLINEDRSTPVVSIAVWYHVGAKNEQPGRTGLAHLFEHMMFQGSANVRPGEYYQRVIGAGGTTNATTDPDRTLYFVRIPTAELETILSFEADRMATAGQAIDQQRFDAQREVVKNERRQRLDNQPYGLSLEVVPPQLYATGQPYSWVATGSMADLSAATLEDARSFFSDYYKPNNAVLVISGDVRADSARRLVEKYFGRIPAGSHVVRPSAPRVRLDRERRVVLEDPKARTPQLRLVWSTAGMRHSDRAALDAIANVLSAERTGLLTRGLMVDRPLASDVTVFNVAREDVGEFWVIMTARPGVTLEQLEVTTDSVLRSIGTDSASALELRRFQRQYAVNTLLGLRSTLSRAIAFANAEGFFGDPLEGFKRQEAIDRLTNGDLKLGVDTYLGDRRLVLGIVPAGRVDMMSKPDRPFTNVTPAPEAR